MLRLLCRFAHVLALAIFIAQASGVGRLLAQDTCADGCDSGAEHTDDERHAANDLAEAADDDCGAAAHLGVAGDDDCETCPPGCGACACCAHVRSIAAPRMPLLVSPETEASLILRRCVAPPAVDPRAIEHIPRTQA